MSVNNKNNNITLYIEVPMCGLVIQMETFMMYDSTGQSFLSALQRLLVMIAIQCMK